MVNQTCNEPGFARPAARIVFVHSDVNVDAFTPLLNFIPKQYIGRGFKAGQNAKVFNSRKPLVELVDNALDRGKTGTRVARIKFFPSYCSRGKPLP